jgi:exopolyphosphatase/guanosine-5'-triphosphate,3'-diphosphate pyrophosphatase
LSGLNIDCDTLRRSARLCISQSWAELWPQSAHLLREEKTAWQKTDWAFQVQTD